MKATKKQIQDIEAICLEALGYSAPVKIALNKMAEEQVQSMIESMNAGGLRYRQTAHSLAFEVMRNRLKRRYRSPKQVLRIDWSTGEQKIDSKPGWTRQIIAFANSYACPVRYYAIS